MTTEIAVTSDNTTLAIAANQTTFTPTQMAALAQLGIDDAPAAQIDLFFHQCRKTGLDPFRRQIYMIGRKTKVGGYRGEPERWETKYTIQTGIDGYRLNGRRAAKVSDATLKKEGPFWRGLDSDWADCWLNPNQPPAAAKFIIYRDGEPFSGVVHFWEYVQTTGFGESQRPNAQWSKMPAHMLGKCAEALAWRMAFEDDFSGLLLEDAIAEQLQHPVVDSDTGPVKRQGPRGSDGLGAALGVAKKTPQEPAQPATAPQAEETDASLATKAQIKHLSDLLDKERCTTPESKREWIEAQTGKSDPRTLLRAEAGDLIQFLTDAQTADATKSAPAPEPEEAPELPIES